MSEAPISYEEDTALRKAVDAYDAARMALAGLGPYASGSMSEENKRNIAPMIKAAIDAYITDTKGE